VEPSQRRTLYVYALFSFALVVCMVLYPDTAFRAAVQGLTVWWNVVFPALLPFFIGAQLLMGLGVVHFMGVLLEPLMRPAFNVPGVGGFVMAMGLASGYPIGAVLTAKLRRAVLVTKWEAERLMSFTNTADPLFMAGAVAVGMFGNAGVAGVIMTAHYLSSLSTGLILRFYAPRAPTTSAGEGQDRRATLFGRAARAMIQARIHDGRPFGSLLGDAVQESVSTLLLIGGFIILFSTIIQILGQVGVVSLLGAGFSSLLCALGMEPGLGDSLVNGLFEITLGCQTAAAAAASLPARLVVSGVIIAWSGVSVHAQVAAMTQDTDIDMRPYLASRLVHAVLAGAFTFLLLGRSGLAEDFIAPVFAHLGAGRYVVQPWAARLLACSRAFGWSVLGLLGFALLYGLMLPRAVLRFRFRPRPPRSQG